MGLDRGLGFRGGGLEFFELHLQLVEQLAATFRGGTEALALQLGDQHSSFRCATIASAPAARASDSCRAARSASSAAFSASISSGRESTVLTPAENHIAP
jgi:hypothetical protein